MSDIKIFDQEARVSIKVYEHTEMGALPYYLFHEGLPHEVAAFYSFKHDLKEAQDTLLYLKEELSNKEIPDLIKSSIFFGAVIKYFRCFSYTSSGRRKKLVYTKVFKGIDPNFMELFIELKSLRDDYIAHANTSQHESIVMVAYLTIPSIEKKIYSMEFASRTMYWDEDSINNLLSIIQVTLDYIEKTIVAFIPQMEKFVETLDISKLYGSSKVPNRLFYFEDTGLMSLK